MFTIQHTRQFRKSVNLFIFLVSIFLSMIFSATSFAGLASDDPFDITQPDGTKFKARVRGDEWLNWNETEDGYKYVQKLKELGITTGCGSNLYCPNNVVSRDQMSAFISRAFLGMQ